MSNKIVEFNYSADEIVAGKNGETIKILHRLVPLSRELGEPAYLVSYRNKVITMLENDIEII